MSISAIGSSYGQTSSVKVDNSSKIASLQKQRESLVSEKQEVQSSDSEDKDSEIELLDAQIQMIDAQIQQLQSQQQQEAAKAQGGNKQDTTKEAASMYLKEKGDEVKGGVVLSGSLKEAIANYKYDAEEEQQQASEIQ